MISFIVPVHVWNEKTLHCHEQLKQQLGKHQLIIVADQCDLPDLETEIVKTPSRLYAAGSRNLGAKHAKHDILVFIDSDILVPDDFVEHCEQNYTADQEQIICFPLGLEITSSYTAGFKGMLEHYSSHYVYAHPRDSIKQLHGYCCVITKILFEKTGGWVETRTMELEEYATAIHQSGVEILLENTVLVKHYNHHGIDLFKHGFDRASVWTQKKLSGKVDWDSKHKDKKNAIGSLFSLLLWPSLLHPATFVVWLIAHKMLHAKWLWFLFTHNSFGRYFIYAIIHVIYLNTIALGAVTGFITNKIITR